MGFRTSTNLIVVHCSATPEGRDVTAKQIDSWHRERGFAKIGYHYVIRLDGTIETGRAQNEIGAHVKNKNSTSIGVCLIGGVSADNIKLAKDTFTAVQKEALRGLVLQLLKAYPEAKVCGHRDLDDGKACPSFSVSQWLQGVGLNDAVADCAKGA